MAYKHYILRLQISVIKRRRKILCTNFNFISEKLGRKNKKMRKKKKFIQGTRQKTIISIQVLHYMRGIERLDLLRSTVPEMQLKKKKAKAKEINQEDKSFCSPEFVLSTQIKFAT
ncbi:hypothetical protein PHYBLDRAFT_60998 [Phycomyces blakesleeanus NRRL 1555(-)]|uniref:Uncharacterized protein n=1 Tax=Phycomyces blakesleeanus (strain ATCC 8743b / DSM 1359 / FGSC 10004 / NBRC 33097 / NRRL 1555) TaxID=763407 RepID=A0A167PGL2_PHYB8|nr:hypothetical protein PHYBLDRAFT_60998 [Phycomyces blakesleeanus NRRL 1555(-)]OAD77874.1 hypothetical protein PHYBLDRAFT_60998 [Phycomyces blakesleeanus NRRL 1555(-)]|eukprot:XP_018295914.1 hypothetical protein PHYBLDRAFT_60998 [Phycomyces blakesleeanus NRRL 1555(-)]